jgi:hypothetical protein
LTITGPGAKVLAISGDNASRIFSVNDGNLGTEWNSGTAPNSGTQVIWQWSLTSPNQPVAVPIAVLAQLVASGVPAKRATQIVTDLIRRGASNRQFVDLGNNVNADVERGARVMASLDVRLQGLTAVLAPAGNASTTADGLQAASGPKKP